jgi:orotate phosphoribosyltransferase
MNGETVGNKRVYGREQIIEKFHKFGIIKRKGPDYPEGFKLKSGKISDIYINIRDLIRIPSLFNFTMHAMHQLISNNVSNELQDPCIIGIPTMGAVIAPIMAYKKSCRLAVIRQNKRDHGIGKDVEGDLTKNIIMVDDVITSGSSIRETIANYITPAFGNDYHMDIFVIVDRQEGLNKMNVQALATLEEIRQFEPKIK